MITVEYVCFQPLAVIHIRFSNTHKPSQQQASEILGMPQSKISNMLRGNFRGISESKMLECLNLLGRDIQIVIKKAPRAHSTGHTSVVFA